MSKTNKKKNSFVYKFFSIILSIISIILVSSLISINILNITLLLLVIIFILGIVLISIFLMFKTKIKKVGLIFSIILTIIYSVLSFYIIKTNGLLTNLNLNYKKYNYSVLVLKTSNYKKIKDIAGLEIGYYDDGSIEGDKSLDKVMKKVEVNTNFFNSTNDLINSLLDEEIESIIIEKSYLELLSDNIDYKDKLREIYDFSIISNTSDISKDIDVLKEPFNIYLSGIDTYGDIANISRSDVNMVISVNPTTREILLTSIPRDYYISLHGKSGYKDKLTHASLYGTDMSISSIEDLLDCEINYYVKVNFSSVLNIVDAIGGINVYSSYDFISRDNYSYKKGYNKVNGEEALSFARERKAFTSGDRQRVINQQEVFKAIFEKVKSKAIITKYTKILNSIEGSFVTNMPISRITSLIRLQLSKNYSWNIDSYTLDGVDGSNYTYSNRYEKSYVMIPNEESVNNAIRMINDAEKGNSLKDNEDIAQVVKTDNDLSIKLVRDKFILVKGEEYIYHGYMAYYNGEDITANETIEELFTVNGKSFKDYRELVSYITYNLDVGEYSIKYKITYKDETKVVKQKLIIVE